jgi:hypothetical protein
MNTTFISAELPAETERVFLYTLRKGLFCGEFATQTKRKTGAKAPVLSFK